MIGSLGVESTAAVRAEPEFEAGLSIVQHTLYLGRNRIYVMIRKDQCLILPCTTGNHIHHIHFYHVTTFPRLLFIFCNLGLT